MSQLKLKHPEFDPSSVKFDTVEVHGGEPRDMYGALIPPHLPDVHLLLRFHG